MMLLNSLSKGETYDGGEQEVVWQKVQLVDLDMVP